MTRPPPCSTLFPYTTLFRSGPLESSDVELVRILERDFGLVGDGLGHGFRLLHGISLLLRGLTRSPHDLDQLPDRKSTRLNSSHLGISYAVFCLKKKTTIRLY